MAKFGILGAGSLCLLVGSIYIYCRDVSACDGHAKEKPAAESKAEAPSHDGSNQQSSTMPGLNAPQVSSNPIPFKMGEGKVECSDGHHKVTCVGPHAACPESEKVIETLKQLASAYTEGNFTELSKYMDIGVTTFDEGSHRLIVGKDAVIDDIKKRWEAAHAENAPVLSYTINNPYAQVTGDRAVVTFEAIKTVGGKHPETLVSRCTDIFVKRDDGWKKLHYRACWKKAKAGAGT